MQARSSSHEYILAYGAVLDLRRYQAQGYRKTIP